MRVIIKGEFDHLVVFVAMKRMRDPSWILDRYQI